MCVPYSNQQVFLDESAQAQPTINNILYQKTSLVKQGQINTLIGAAAQDIRDHLPRYDSPDYTLGGFGVYRTFSRSGGDIVASLGSISSYAAIITEMNNKGECNVETANIMLQNLSSPVGKNYSPLYNGLGDCAKKLMSALICEAIRFQDDGLIERAALREVIDNGGDFYGAFLQGPSIAYIFAQENGTERMKVQILESNSGSYNDNYNADKQILEARKDYFLADENFQSNGNSQSSYSVSSRGRPLVLTSKLSPKPPKKRGTFTENFHLGNLD